MGETGHGLHGRLYVYGNYIDEPLIVVEAGTRDPCEGNVTFIRPDGNETECTDSMMPVQAPFNNPLAIINGDSSVGNVINVIGSGFKASLFCQACQACPRSPWLRCHFLEIALYVTRTMYQGYSFGRIALPGQTMTLLGLDEVTRQLLASWSGIMALCLCVIMIMKWVGGI